MSTLLLAMFITLAGLPAKGSTLERLAFTVVYDSFARFIYSEKNKVTGLYVDILNEALENRLGIPVRFRWLPWQRAQFSVENGLADAMVTVATPARLAYSGAGEEPVAISRIGLFTAADHPRLEQMQQIGSLEDLDDYQILTYLGDGWAEEFLTGLTVDASGSDLQAVLRKLAWGRGDLFPQIEDVTRHYISELNFEEVIIQVPGIELGNIEFRVMISKKSSYLGLLPQIDQALRSMREDGTMDRLEKKYNGG